MPIDARGPWLSLEPEAAAPLFFALDASWWVTGGWALDLFLGRKGEHHDLDLAMLRREQDEVRTHLAAWDLHIHHEATLTQWAPGTRLPHDRQVVWGRTAPYLPWQVELYFENAEGDQWVYAGDERVRLPLIALGLETPGGLPYVRPEVVLLHRAARQSDSDDADLGAVAKRLTTTGRTWLRESLELVYPGHRWLAALRE